MTDIPRIDGWRVTHADGFLHAARAGFLTGLQIRYGCQPAVSALEEGELRVQCAAEDMKADMVALAERLARQMLAADEARASALTGRGDPDAR